MNFFQELESTGEQVLATVALEAAFGGGGTNVMEALKTTAQQAVAGSPALSESAIAADLQGQVGSLIDRVIEQLAGSHAGTNTFAANLAKSAVMTVIPSIVAKEYSQAGIAQPQTLPLAGSEPGATETVAAVG